jgi:carbamoyl-phosphate synthase large subunit
VQYAVKADEVYVIEANPRASRTVPFVAKATGVPLVKVAARVMVGETLASLRAEGLLRLPVGGHMAVKEAVLPFNRFPDVDTVLGPEMRSTGEVMGIDRTFGLAFGKAQVAAGDRLPASGMVFLSLADRDKDAGLRAATRFVELGFEIAATAGTADYLERHGLPVSQRVAKVARDDGAAVTGDGLPTALDLIGEGKVQLVVNSPRGRGARADGAYIRRAANQHRIPCLTTAAAALAAAESTIDRSNHNLRVRTLQEYQGAIAAHRT